MNPSPLKPITAVILTYNEALHIERCIQSLKPIAEKIYVVDSFSTDDTVKLARSLGAEVLQRVWKNYADQFQWGLDHCQAETEWVMRIDGNEYVEPSLQIELQDLLISLPKDIIGVYLKLKVLYDDKWIRYGGFYPLFLLRIWRTGQGRIEQRWMDEHIVLPPGANTEIAQGHLVDDNRKGITFWIEKHNKYASREAVDLLNTKYGLFERDEGLKALDDPQAKRKRLLKEKVYGRLPIGLRAGMYFFYRYFMRLGFLDGGKGFVWHFMQGFWYRLLVDIKVMEIETRSEGDIKKMKEIILKEHGLMI